MNNIPLKYIDFRSATEAAIKDFPYMKYIYESAKQEISNIEEQMAAVHSPSWDGMPKVHNNNANEERILNGMEKIDALQTRYKEAVDYMQWFLPAWGFLDEDDQYTLTEYFLFTPQERAIARYTVAEHFSIDRSSATRKKHRAVGRLQTLLYGRR